MKMDIDSILHEAAHGREITPGELLFLLKTNDGYDRIIQTADTLNRSINGQVVSFVHNRNINYTNICQNHCLFCGFRRGEADPDTFLMTIHEVLDAIAETPHIDEICIQGGINRQAGLAYALKMLEAVKAAFPHIHIHAFSPMELEFFCRESGLSIEDTIGQLMKAGLGSIPGTAAEILDDDIRQCICPEKLSANEWIRIVTTAHRMGLQSTSTIMMGHIESPEHITRHLASLRRIQKQTRGFTEFIPLFFIPYKTRLARIHGLTEVIPFRQIMRFIALSRIFFHGSIGNIQSSWPKLGLKGALQCLSAGANDLGGTLYDENITRSAGGTYGEYISLEDLQSGISQTGKIPRQRDTLYNELATLKRTDTNFSNIGSP